MSGAPLRRAICTIVARNYLAQARVLRASALEHEPWARFITLVIDGIDSDRGVDGVGEVVLPEELGMPASELAAMRLSYDVMEYATALKPALMIHILRTDARVVAYLDPDIQIFAPLDQVFDRAATDGLVLTPHTIEPVPRDNRMLDESVIMHAGMYNLGFIAAGGSALRFLAWWRDRLRTDAIVDVQNALFTDQRWVDWAPALTQPAILRHKGLNAAYWNLHERPIERRPDGTWTAGGEPLVFFHFSGYDPASPWVLSKHQGPAPRGLLSENPALRELCDSYGGALVAAGHLTMRTQAYRNDVLPSGLRLTPLIRRMCRDAVVGVDPDLGVPPDPWSSETEFLEWLFADDLGTGAWRHSRFERALWRARSDLRVVFPDPAMGSAEAFRTWLDEAPDMVHQYTAAGLDERPERAGLTRPKARSRRHRRGGWSVISYARAELGVGEAGRRIGQAVAASGAPWEMVGLTDGSLSRQQHGYRGPLATVPSYANQVWCVNADQTPRLAAALGPSADGIRIGVWFWELEDFPRHFVDAFRHVDEVWVTSEFNRESISRVADKPVRLVPLPVRSAAGTPRYTRDQLGVPRDRTAFLVNFDYLSVMRRKNPIGAIEAFTRAFEPSDGAVLLIKSINGDKRLIDRERVRIAAAGRPDIIFMEHYMSAAELRGLTAVVDCVVSLHRSEGYGLNLADAMAQEKPVIATGYSGNMQFMDEGSAFLVPWQRAEVGPDAGPYSPEATWAEPDVDVAAQHMRVVAGDPSAVARVVQTARRKLACYSRASVGAAVRPLLVPDVLERSGRSLR